MSTIRWSPTTSMWLDGAPGTVILGSPGSGKTFFMLNIAANCLGMGQKVVSEELALKMVDIFLSTEFEGGRHSRRVDLLTDIENGKKLEP